MQECLPKETNTKLWPVKLTRNNGESDEDFAQRTYDHFVQLVREEFQTSDTEKINKYQNLTKLIDVKYVDYLDQLELAAKQANITDQRQIRHKFIENIRHPGDRLQIREYIDHQNMDIRKAAKIGDERQASHDKNVFHVELGEEIDRKFTSYQSELKQEINNLKSLVIANVSGNKTPEKKENTTEGENKS